MEPSELTMVFGSDSDEKKILPGIIRATKEIKGLKVRVHYASADNTPEKVDKVLYIPDEEPVPVITGAGMSNVLTGVAKVKATLYDLVIGVPITDSATGGLSSLLSTSEKPPLNPVLMVPLDNTYAAAQIAVRYINKRYGGVVVADNSACLSNPVSADSIADMEKQLTKLGIDCQVYTPADINPDDIVITVFSHHNLIDKNYYEGTQAMNAIDRRLRAGRGIQIGVREKAEVKRWDAYMNCLQDLEVTGIVGIGRYENAAMVAAQIIGHGAALKSIDDAKYRKDPANPENDGKCVKLERHKGFTVEEGEVHREAA